MGFYFLFCLLKIKLNSSNLFMFFERFRILLCFFFLSICWIVLVDFLLISMLTFIDHKLFGPKRCRTYFGQNNDDLLNFDYLPSFSGLNLTQPFFLSLLPLPINTSNLWNFWCVFYGFWQLLTNFLPFSTLHLILAATLWRTTPNSINYLC